MDDEEWQLLLNDCQLATPTFSDERLMQVLAKEVTLTLTLPLTLTLTLPRPLTLTLTLTLPLTLTLTLTLTPNPNPNPNPNPSPHLVTGHARLRRAEHVAVHLDHPHELPPPRLPELVFLL